jgi:hypothetical protein
MGLLGKIKRRQKQIEESVARYMSQLDTADRRIAAGEDPSEAVLLSKTRVFTRPGSTADSCTAAISTPFDHLLGAREQRCRHFEGLSTYTASIRRRVQPLRPTLAQLQGFAILRWEETRCYELRGAHPAAW